MQSVAVDPQSELLRVKITSADVPLKSILNSVDSLAMGITELRVLNPSGPPPTSSVAHPVELAVSGMTCESCINTVSTALRAVPGVSRVQVTLGKVLCWGNVASSNLVSSLQSVGFESQLTNEGSRTVAPSHPLHDEPSHRIFAPFESVSSKRHASLPNVDGDVHKEKFRLEAHSVFSVEGMKCASCVAKVERTICAVPDVFSAAVALLTERADVIHGLNCDIHAIKHAVVNIGHQCELLSSSVKAGSVITVSILGLVPGSGGETEAATLLRSLPGVVEVNVVRDGSKVLMHVSLSARGGAGPRDMVDALAGKGFAAAPVDSWAAGERRLSEGTMRDRAKWLRLLLISAGFTIPIMIIHTIALHGWQAGLHCVIGGLTFCEVLMFFLATPIQIYVGSHFYKSAWHDLRAGSIGMDFLISVATTAAYVFSIAVLIVKAFFWADFPKPCTFETAAMLLTFICLGRYLEARARGRTTSAIASLLQSRPRGALLVEQGAGSDNKRDENFGALPTRWIQAGLVQSGDILRVSPGCRVPCDGVVVEGTTYIDESMMTGEGIPVCKATGDTVFGGSVNQLGVMHISATKVGQESALGKIVALVEEAQSSKPPVQAFADRVAAWFAPLILCLSAAVFCGWYFILLRTGGLDWPVYGVQVDPMAFSLLTAVAVLVVACPCALGLATPTAIMVGSGVGATQGVLIKGGVAFEATHRATSVIFDKTGTLTEGACEVMDVFSVAGNPGEDQKTASKNLLSLAAAVEAYSEHPFGRAITSAAGKKGLDTQAFITSDWECVPGKGVRCTVSQMGQVALGTRQWMAEHGATKADDVALENFVERSDLSGWSTVFLCVDGMVKGAISMGDTPRPEAKSTVAALQAMGLDVGLMTGDAAPAALAIARLVGIPGDRVMARMMPEGKASAIRALQKAGAIVIFAGDGVNDSPALAVADVGMAVGAGTEVAIAAADMVLVRSNLDDVTMAIDLSRTVFRRIQINFAWALGYNIVAIPLAAGLFLPTLGLSLTPEVAAVFMACSSIAVLFSSLLLRFYRRPGHERTAILRSKLRRLSSNLSSIPKEKRSKPRSHRRSIWRRLQGALSGGGGAEQAPLLPPRDSYYDSDDGDDDYGDKFTGFETRRL